ncbi:hypothetical protein D3C72_2123360 [compost metagenome]
MKLELVQPISFALVFINLANSSTDPEICSAITLPASFADLINNNCRSCCIVNSSPICIAAFEYPGGIVITAL